MFSRREGVHDQVPVADVENDGRNTDLGQEDLGLSVWHISSLKVGSEITYWHCSGAGEWIIQLGRQEEKEDTKRKRQEEKESVGEHVWLQETFRAARGSGSKAFGWPDVDDIDDTHCVSGWALLPPRQGWL